MRRKMITIVLFVMIIFGSSALGVFGSFSKAVEDTLYHNPQKTSDKIRIIKIDEKTINELGAYSQWDRSTYAKLLNALCVSDEVKPAVVGFDIIFSAEKDSQSDAAFVEACEKHGNVVCAFSYVFTKELYEDANGTLLVDKMAVSETVMPFEKLKQVTKQGFVNALLDSEDGYIRSALLSYEEKDGKVTKNFGVEVSDAYLSAIGAEMSYLTEEQVMHFRYSGSVNEYETISLCDVLSGKIPAEAFNDCIVLVGAWEQGNMDSYYVPIDRGQQMYGVEIHANIIQALLEGKDIERIPVWVNGAVAAVVAVALILICEKITVMKGIVLCLGVGVVKLVVDEFLFEAGYSVDHITIPLIAIIIAIYYVVLHYYVARQTKQRIEKAFSKYVAPQVVKEIAKNGTYELKLGGENRDIAVLFVDIRGFTPLSESLEPEQVVLILNRYLEMVTECIFKNGGTLDKFIGDAAMAVYNAPFDTEDYVYKAVQTAWDIVQSGKELEEELAYKYGKDVGFGVGVNCGPAVVGNIGSDFRMDYTAIGDTVNTAARLEANAPKGKIYISENVYQNVKNRINVEEIGEIPLKGKSVGITVYSVLDIKGGANEGIY